MKKQTTEKTLKLNMVNLGHVRNVMIGFVAGMSVFTMIGSIGEGISTVQVDTEFHKTMNGNRKFSRQEKKDLAKDLAWDALLTIGAFAVLVITMNALRASKRYNDDAAMRVARRYLLEMRQKNPVLKQYDNVLNNQMALYNIAAGVANMLPSSALVEFGGQWDMARYKSEDVDNRAAELRIKNNTIADVIQYLHEYTDTNPYFMGKLTALVADSSKTFALNQISANAKVR